MFLLHGLFKKHQDKFIISIHYQATLGLEGVEARKRIWMIRMKLPLQR